MYWVVQCDIVLPLFLLEKKQALSNGKMQVFRRFTVIAFIKVESRYRVCWY